MSWPTDSYIPAEVTAMRDMINASATWVANGGFLQQIHYPDMVEALDTLYPAALIIPTTYTSTPYAAGAGGLPSGDMRLEIYVQGSIAFADYMGHNIATDIAAMQTGLAIRSAQAGEAQDISPGLTAAIDDGTALSKYAVSIYIQYGLSV